MKEQYSERLLMPNTLRSFFVDVESEEQAAKHIKVDNRCRVIKVYEVILKTGVIKTRSRKWERALGRLKLTKAYLNPSPFISNFITHSPFVPVFLFLVSRARSSFLILRSLFNVLVTSSAGSTCKINVKVTMKANLHGRSQQGK